MTDASAQLQLLMDLDDPFEIGLDQVGELQLEALRERLAHCREHIQVLDRRARDLGIETVDSLDDVLGLLFAHQTYKSYPDTWVAKGQWTNMNRWLETLSTGLVTGMDVDGVADTDGWIARLRDNGHHVVVSSGTSGKTSFLNRTVTDRQYVARNTVKQMATTLGIEKDNDRPVFLLGPRTGVHDFVDVMHEIGDRFGRPGEVHWLSQESLSEAENRRLAGLRRKVADGTASPSEIAAVSEVARQRQEQMRESVASIADRLLDRRGEPVIIVGFWLVHFLLMEEARRRGMRDGDLHPESGILVGGGTKGAALPEDYREQIERFHGLDSARYFRVYGMAEMSSPFFCCEAGRYHCPPWVTMLILDRDGEKLLSPADGRVDGRMGFFDAALDGRWAGVITGDKVEADFLPCGCGRRSPSLLSIARYADIGDDKLTCAGTMASYVRGAIGDE